MKARYKESRNKWDENIDNRSESQKREDCFEREKMKNGRVIKWLSIEDSARKRRKH